MVLLKKAELCAELRDAAGAVYHSEEDELLTTAGDSIPDMQRIYQHIQELDQKITEEQSTVDRLDDQIENTDNDGVERLLQSLDLDSKLIGERNFPYFLSPLAGVEITHMMYSNY